MSKQKVNFKVNLRPSPRQLRDVCLLIHKQNILCCTGRCIPFKRGNQKLFGKTSTVDNYNLEIYPGGLGYMLRDPQKFNLNPL